MAIALSVFAWHSCAGARGGRRTIPRKGGTKTAVGLVAGHLRSRLTSHNAWNATEDLITLGGIAPKQQVHSQRAVADVDVCFCTLASS